MSQSEESVTPRKTRSAKKGKEKMANEDSPGIPHAESSLEAKMDKLFEQINTKISAIHKDVKEIQGAQGTVTSLSTSLTQVTERFSDIEDLVANDNLHLKILTGVVIKQEEEIERLKAQVKTLQNKEVRNNLLVGGLIEAEGENCKQKVLDFFKDIMLISEHIEVTQAYRQGPAKPDFTRNIIVQTEESF